VRQSGRPAVGEVFGQEAVAGCLLEDSRDQSQVVEGGRPQTVDQAPDIRDGLLGLALELQEQCVGGFRFLLGES
jgi:hypothetical protein